jgi:hypothetical protein
MNQSIIVSENDWADILDAPRASVVVRSAFIALLVVAFALTTLVRPIDAIVAGDGGALFRVEEIMPTFDPPAG